MSIPEMRMDHFPHKYPRKGKKTNENKVKTIVKLPKVWGTRP